MAELIETGLAIMLVGMVVVFTMLTLLIYIIKAMSVLSRIIDAASAPPPPAPSPPPGALRRADDDELAGVISAAIRMHRRKR